MSNFRRASLADVLVERRALLTAGETGRHGLVLLFVGAADRQEDRQGNAGVQAVSARPAPAWVPVWAWCVKTLGPSALGQLEFSLPPLFILFLIFSAGVCYNLPKVGKYSDRPELSNTAATGNTASAQEPQGLGWHRMTGF